jgi:hypothetical protein
MARPKKTREWKPSRLTVDIPAELHKELAVLAIREEMDMRDLIVKWIESGLLNAGVKLSRKYSDRS